MEDKIDFLNEMIDLSESLMDGVLSAVDFRLMIDCLKSGKSLEEAKREVVKYNSF